MRIHLRTSWLHLLIELRSRELPIRRYRVLGVEIARGRRRMVRQIARQLRCASDSA